MPRAARRTHDHCRRQCQIRLSGCVSLSLLVSGMRLVRGTRGPPYHPDQVQVMLPGAALAPFAMKPKVADLPAASVPL